jgi:hypothetical protein
MALSNALKAEFQSGAIIFLHRQHDLDHRFSGTAIDIF